MDKREFLLQKVEGIKSLLTADEAKDRAEEIPKGLYSEDRRRIEEEEAAKTGEVEKAETPVTVLAMDLTSIVVNGKYTGCFGDVVIC